MGRMLRFAGYLFIGILFIYIVNVFYQGNFDITQWSDSSRKSAAGFTIAWMIGLVIGLIGD